MVVSLKIDGVPVDMNIVSRVLSYFFFSHHDFFRIDADHFLSRCHADSVHGHGRRLSFQCRFDDGPLWRHRYSVAAGVDEGILRLFNDFSRVEIFSILLVIQHSVGYVWRRW